MRQASVSVPNIWHYAVGIVYLCTCFSTVSGQCDDSTRPLALTVTSSPQYVSSPGYPDTNYPSNLDCAWLLTTHDSTARIVINIEDYDSEGTAPCKYDYISVHDGDNATFVELARLCATNAEDINGLTSSGNTLFITFVSDNFLEYKGFNVLYFENDTSLQPDCGSDLTATLTPQVLMSSNLPTQYTNDSNCFYSIGRETYFYGTRIKFYFMDLEANDASGASKCATKDHVEISEGANTTTMTQLQLWCYSSVTYEFTDIDANAEFVYLNFTTNNDDNVYLGFMLTYEEVFKGVNMSRPAENETVTLEVPETITAGNVNTTVGLVEATAFGDLQAILTENGVPTTDFALTPESASSNILYLDLVGALDYENKTAYTLLVWVSSPDVPSITATATFQINVVDEDDIAPVFQNLPASVEVLRSAVTGHSVFTAFANDSDSSPEFTDVVYGIEDDDDNILNINSTSGEITLSTDLIHFPLTTTESNITVVAYSVSNTSKLTSTAILAISIPPDTPPICTPTSLYADTLDTVSAGPRFKLTYPEPSYECTDENEITYSIGTVSPTLTLPLFTVHATTGIVSLIRSFDLSEVPGRALFVEVVATDSINQTTSVSVSMNVSAFSCSPNPMPLYVRANYAVGTIVLTDFHCTTSVGLTFNVTQYPSGVFAIEKHSGTDMLVLKAIVYKIRFYTLTMKISDGVDTITLRFKVTIQSEKCSLNSINGGDPPISQWTWAGMLIYLMMNVF